jgi:hypothetical protein
MLLVDCMHRQQNPGMAPESAYFHFFLHAPELLPIGDSGGEWIIDSRDLHVDNVRGIAILASEE